MEIKPVELTSQTTKDAYQFASQNAAAKFLGVNALEVHNAASHDRPVLNEFTAEYIEEVEHATLMLGKCVPLKKLAENHGLYESDLGIIARSKDGRGVPNIKVTWEHAISYLLKKYVSV